jgi:uncharacterized protein YdeI (YjbR/CyaY-like superfamily)
MVSVADKPVLDLTVEQWGEWLATSDDVVGVRLKLRKKTSSAPGMTWSEALDVALCHGWIDGQNARLDDDYMLTASHRPSAFARSTPTRSRPRSSPA